MPNELSGNQIEEIKNKSSDYGIIGAIIILVIVAIIVGTIVDFGPDVTKTGSDVFKVIICVASLFIGYWLTSSVSNFTLTQLKKAEIKKLNKF